MTFDRRITPLRDDLAADRLRGAVDAPRFAKGTPHQVTAGSAPIRAEPRPDSLMTSECLFGERFTVFDECEGWAWGQLETDGYVGYVPVSDLGDTGPPATHRVGVLRTFLYPAADLKTPPLAVLSLGALASVKGLDGDYAELAGGGCVFARHLVATDHVEPDFVAVAETFLGTPYFWGGRTSIGLDCSALIQIALRAAGQPAPRDSDMLEASAGVPLDMAALDGGLERGDLIFWRGHLGVMVDADRMLHANGHHMNTVIEPVAGAVERIAREWGPVTSLRRAGTGRADQNSPST